MKFLENRTKSAIYTFLIHFLIIGEMGILTGFRFTLSDKYANGLTMDKVANLTQVGSKVGWNFVVASCLIILGMLGYAMLLGYNRNPSGMISMVVMDLLPLIGLVYGYNFFYGYGTSHMLPAMSIFGLHTGSKAGQIIFIAIIAVLTIVFWILGKYIRSIYAKKYEFD